jgi:cytochrome P460
MNGAIMNQPVRIVAALPSQPPPSNDFPRLPPSPLARITSRRLAGTILLAGLTALAARRGLPLEWNSIEAASALRHDATGAPAAGGAPTYVPGGQLALPADYRTWTFVGSSIGLSYSERGRDNGPGMFHRVYLEPRAYERYRATGAFPEKTVFVMEIYTSEQKGGPARAGFFEGERVAVEASVKDSATFSDGWAYFDFENGARSSAPAIPSESCFVCHRAHAADDNVFTQFYPMLRHVKSQNERFTGQ